MEITSCLHTVRPLRAGAELEGGEGGGARGVGGEDPVAVQIVDSHFSPNTCQHILQMSSGPAEVKVGSPVAGWLGGWGRGRGQCVLREREGGERGREGGWGLE